MAKKKKSRKATKAAKRPAAKAKKGKKAKKAKKAVVRKASKRAVAKKAKRPAVKAKKRPAKKARKAKTRDVIGEGNYTAAREFRKDEEAFVRANRSRIPQMGQDAEAALDGPEGGELRRAEDEARAHARD